MQTSVSHGAVQNQSEEKVIGSSPIEIGTRGPTKKKPAQKALSSQSAVTRRSLSDAFGYVLSLGGDTPRCPDRGSERARGQEQAKRQAEKSGRADTNEPSQEASQRFEHRGPYGVTASPKHIMQFVVSAGPHERVGQWRVANPLVNGQSPLTNLLTRLG